MEERRANINYDVDDEEKLAELEEEAVEEAAEEEVAEEEAAEEEDAQE